MIDWWDWITTERYVHINQVSCFRPNSKPKWKTALYHYCGLWFLKLPFNSWCYIPLVVMDILVKIAFILVISCYLDKWKLIKLLIQLNSVNVGRMLFVCDWQSHKRIYQIFCWQLMAIMRLRILYFVLISLNQRKNGNMVFELIESIS